MFAKSFSFTVLSHLKQIFSSTLPLSLPLSLSTYIPTHLADTEGEYNGHELNSTKSYEAAKQDV